MSEAKDLTEIRKQIQQRSAEQKLTRRSTMSVPEMRKLLGLKKTDSTGWSIKIFLRLK